MEDSSVDQVEAKLVLDYKDPLGKLVSTVHVTIAQT